MSGLDQDQSIDEWERLYDHVTAHEKACQGILTALRADQGIPSHRVDNQRHSLEQTHHTVDTTKGLHDIDRAEFHTILKRLRSFTHFLHERAAGFTKFSQDEVAQILSHQDLEKGPIERLIHYRRAVMLMLLSRPHGKAFWDFTRLLSEALDRDLKESTPTDQDELVRLRRTVRVVAPDWIFRDHTPAVPISRYAFRDTQVRGMYQGGLPGLGKRR